jgi:hypothetical protein
LQENQQLTQQPEVAAEVAAEVAGAGAAREAEGEGGEGGDGGERAEEEEEEGGEAYPSAEMAMLVGEYMDRQQQVRRSSELGAWGSRFRPLPDSLS